MPSYVSIMIQAIRKLREAAYKETGDPHISGWELRRSLNASDDIIGRALAYAEADIITDEDAQYGIPDDYPGTEELAISHVFQEECLDVIATLPEKEADVLCRRNGFPPYEKAYTLEDIGKAYGVTRERIRQIEAKAYRRLRRPERMRKLRC